MSNNVITLPQFDEMLAVYLEYGDIFESGMNKIEQLLSIGYPISFDETSRIFHEKECPEVDYEYNQFPNKLYDGIDDVIVKDVLRQSWEDGKVYLRIGNDWDFSEGRIYCLKYFLGKPYDVLSTTGRFNEDELVKYLLVKFGVSDVNELSPEDCDKFIKMMRTRTDELKAKLKQLEENVQSMQSDIKETIDGIVSICAKCMHDVYYELYDKTYFVVSALNDKNVPIGSKSAKEVMSELRNGNFDEWYYGEIENGKSVVKIIDLKDYVTPIFQDVLNDMISDLHSDEDYYEL
jgi:hypothetical protein